MPVIKKLPKLPKLKTKAVRRITKNYNKEDRKEIKQHRSAFAQIRGGISPRYGNHTRKGL